jgi:hypothetical protein
MYTIQQVMSEINAHKSLIIMLAFTTYGFGFLQYFSSMYMQVKHKQCPFYFWQHCWYFGHDITFSLLFAQWFYKIDFWLFKVLCIGCMIFVLIEIFSLYQSVKHERQEIWGKYYKNGKVTEKIAWIRGIVGYIIGAALFMTIRLAIGDVTCFVLMMSTNATLAIVTQFRLEEVGIRQKGIIPLVWFTLLGTILTFAPPGIGFFSTAVSALDATWFYVLGVISILCALRYLVLAYRLPKYQN